MYLQVNSHYLCSCGQLSSHKHWISKYWITAHRRNTGSGFFEPLMRVFSKDTQYMTLFYVYFYLKHFNLHCWCINIELTANSPITYAWTKPMRFPHKAYCRVLKLRNTRQHVSGTFWIIFKQWNHQTCGTKWKRRLFTVGELKQERKMLPYLISAGTILVGWLKFFTALGRFT